MSAKVSDLLRVMQRHIGRDNAASVATLSKELGCGERDVRSLVHDLRMDGHHVCAHPSAGYFLANSPDELDETCQFLMRRAVSSLQQISMMKKVSLPDLYQQARFTYSGDDHDYEARN